MALQGTASAPSTRTAPDQPASRSGGRTELLRGRPFLAAYVRAVVGIVSAAALYAGVLVWRVEAILDLAWMHLYTPNIWPAPREELLQLRSIPERVDQDYLAMFDITASTPEMLLQGIWTVLSWPPVLALLLGAGLLSLYLEWRSERAAPVRESLVPTADETP